MIVRDEEQLLPGCLGSVSGVVDEIVAVDTGSSDATPEIVRAHHGLLLRRPWQEDFSAARNVSLDAATGDWILWMDADERLRPEEHGRLRRLIEQNASEDAFSVPIRSETPTGAQVTRAHRLFRNRKGIRFSGRIHEQVSPSFARTGAREGPCADFTIDHLGYNFSADKLRRKYERNLRLLSAAKRQDPRDAYVRYCLGQALMLLGNTAAAENEIRAALGQVPSEPVSKRLPDDIRAAAFNNLAECALGRGAPEEALQRCAESLGICPKQVTAHLMAYYVHRELRRPEQALQALIAADRLLDHPMAGGSATEVTMDRAELWSAMGQSQLQLGQPAQARHSFQRALAARKGRRERTLAALAQCAIAENALDEALRLANEASALAPNDDSPADLACFILAKLGRFSEAAEHTRGLLGRRPLGERIALLRKSLAGAPSPSEGWNDLGVLLFRSGKMDEAADCFKKAYLADPQNLNALESLIELLSRSGKREPAAALALQWTRSHPSCARAWVAWAKLNLLARELASAKTALTRALKIDPANAVVQSALESLEGGMDRNSTSHSALGRTVGETVLM
jgi:tetratricopeptide (TPR) repeat protein